MMQWRIEALHRHRIENRELKLSLIAVFISVIFQFVTLVIFAKYQFYRYIALVLFISTAFLSALFFASLIFRKPQLTLIYSIAQGSLGAILALVVFNAFSVFFFGLNIFGAVLGIFLGDETYSISDPKERTFTNFLLISLVYSFLFIIFIFNGYTSLQVYQVLKRDEISTNDDEVHEGYNESLHAQRCAYSQTTPDSQSPCYVHSEPLNSEHRQLAFSAGGPGGAVGRIVV
uniref:Uncharacterized protein n=2 Tax=Parascaris univalens TaxID=6257 RepID=A0A915AZ64_PARUN